MLKVTHTKNPTLRQLTNIAYNLREKFAYHSKVSMEYHGHTYSTSNCGEINTNFWLHAKGECWQIDTWEQLLAKYEELMQETPNA